MKSKDLIKELEAAGWVLDRIKGSHHQFKHPDHKLPITSKMQNKSSDIVGQIIFTPSDKIGINYNYSAPDVINL